MMNDFHWSRWTTYLGVVLVVMTWIPPLSADGVGDNNPKLRRVPEQFGIDSAEQSRDHVDKRLAELDAASAEIAGDARAVDVQVIRLAVSSAKQYQEFFDANEIPDAYQLAWRKESSGPSNWPRAIHRGQRRRAWWCEVMFRGSTAPCSLRAGRAGKLQPGGRRSTARCLVPRPG